MRNTVSGFAVDRMSSACQKCSAVTSRTYHCVNLTLRLPLTSYCFARDFVIRLRSSLLNVVV
jgi:hypothetical protein